MKQEFPKKTKIMEEKISLKSIEMKGGQFGNVRSKKL